jgi:hypothetical protein
MTSRPIITVGFVVLCGAALWAVVAQGCQLSELRVEKKRLETGNSVAGAPETVAIPSPTPEVPRELLQLRAEVARLSEQQRALAGATKENERLRLQLENRRTNSAAVKAVGAGYIRISEVKWLGYNAPEDTLQSAFWAMQHHDLGKYLDAIRPDVAKEIGDALRNESRTADEFFKDKHLPPIFRITGRQQNDDEVIVLQFEIGPDIPPQTVFVRRVGGQWKLESRL